jgi:CheY-like chemotaxis protein
MAKGELAAFGGRPVALCWDGNLANFDVVLLDMNLDGQRNPETANFLLERGIPFAFVSGYDAVIDPQHADVPLLHKPFTDGELGAVLAELIGPSGVRNEIAEANG